MNTNSNDTISPAVEITLSWKSLIEKFAEKLLRLPMFIENWKENRDRQNVFKNANIFDWRGFLFIKQKSHVMSSKNSDYLTSQIHEITSLHPYIL